MRKTSLAIHAPNPYILDIDNNLASVARQFPTVPFKYDLISEDEHGAAIEKNKRFAHLERCLALAAADPDISTIIIDSLTTLIEVVIDHMRATTPKIANPLEPLRIQDWGTFSYYIRHIITTLKSTNKTIILIAHQKFDQSEVDKTWKLFLNIPGQTATNLSGLFTDVWCPYPHITGINSMQKHEWMVRTLPDSANDHRGAKSSFGFKVVEPYETIKKTLSQIKCNSSTPSSSSSPA
jgi:hypothetical protein